MWFQELWYSLLRVSLEMSPFLLFGFILAGILSVLLPHAWVRRHLAGTGVGPVIKASLLGVPLPLCSCGVIPVSAALRRRGANRAATVSFLVSTPQTGIDSILVTASLLGWVFAVYRTLLAFLSGIVAGLASVALRTRRSTCCENGAQATTKDTAAKANRPAATGAATECAATECAETKGDETEGDETEGDETEGDAMDRILDSACGCGGASDDASPGCCGKGVGSPPPESSSSEGLRSKILRMAHFGLVRLPTELAGPLLLGLAASALIATFVPDDFFAGAFGQTLQGGLIGMIVIMVASVPMYVCATASVPLAWALIDKDATVGMALVFLMTGPATNSATIAALWRILGHRTTIIYLATICAMALAGGLLLDYIFLTTELAAAPIGGELLPFWLQTASTIILFGLMGIGLWRRFVTFRGQLAAARDDSFA